MIALIISIYLFIGLLVTTCFLTTCFSQKGVGEQFAMWYDDAGTPFILLVSVLFLGIGLFWPIVVGILVGSKVHNSKN